MNHKELNTELRDFCQKLIDDGYNKSQLCSLLLGQQKLPMFTQFIENQDRNFGIGVLSNIFEIFGYELQVVPVLKTNAEDPKITDLKNRFIENYRIMLSEGLANQENVKVEREGKVQQAITDVALELFKKIIVK
ncbi:hypothetical protein HN385_07290 [archaeon]|jgi:hypothetical protein|nr:hypothetical protein [archaeon]